MTQHKPVYLTPEGLEELEHELGSLRTSRRRDIADKIHQAKELGTTVNNAEYDDAKREQSFVEGRIRELESLLKVAKVIPHDDTHAYVKVGSRVTVQNQDGQEEFFTIVGTAEAHPLDGKISNESPVGKALMGKKVGDNTKIMVPAGVISYKVTKID
jgi:transcription elongation factor GreA